MTRLDPTDIPAGTSRWSPPSRSWMFWGLLIGGSIAVHGGVLALMQPLTQRFALLAPPLAVTPIDFVELPPEDPALAPPAQPPSAFKTPAKPPSASSASSVVPPVAPALPSAPSSSLDSPVTLDSNAPDSNSIGIAPAPPLPSSPSPLPAAPPPQGSPAPLPSDAPATVATPSIATPEFGGLPTENPHPPVPTPTPSVSPSPLISTMPIDTPVPDVSGTLPLPSASPSPLPSIVTPQGVVPAQLTARLTATPPAPEALEPPLDRTAQPRSDEQTVTVDPSTSPCPVTPEAVEFLGTPVAVQVSTDETGTVTDTVTRESSQNPAYDALAQCIVNNWEFEPALAEGTPVANDALVVKITIERSELPSPLPSPLPSQSPSPSP